MAGRALNQLRIVETYAQTADALHIGLVAQFSKRDKVVSRNDRMVRAWASACVKAEALADALNEINTQLKTRHAKRLKYEAEHGGLIKPADLKPVRDIIEAIEVMNDSTPPAHCP